MLRYILKKIIAIPFMLLVVSVVLFFLVNLSKVDPSATLLGANATQEQRQQLIEELGLDKPLFIQYVNYIKDALHGDFGYSWYSKRDVLDEIQARFPTTLKLALITISFSVMIGIPLGVLCAVKQYHWIDNAVTTTAMCLTGIPEFWIGLMLQLVFSFRLHLLPTYGIKDWKGWIMPVFCLSLPYVSAFIRNVRATMLDCIRQDYIRTARAKGQREHIVIFRHALRNAMLPIITMIGTMIAGLLAGALVIENIFSIPGIGYYIVQSVTNKDIPVVMTGVLFIAIFYLIIMVIIDILYAVVDPRIRASYEGHKRLPRKKLPQQKDRAGG